MIGYISIFQEKYDIKKAFPLIRLAFSMTWIYMFLVCSELQGLVQS